MGCFGYTIFQKFYWRLKVAFTSEKYPPFTVTRLELITVPEIGSLKGPTMYVPGESSVLNLPLMSVTTVFTKLLFESKILISTKDTGLPSKITDPKMPEIKGVGLGVGVETTGVGVGIGVDVGKGVTIGLIDVVGVGERKASETDAFWNIPLTPIK